MADEGQQDRAHGRRTDEEPEDDGGDVFGVAQLAQGDGHAGRQQGRDQAEGDPFDRHGMIACTRPHDDDHADEAHGDGGPAARADRLLQDQEGQQGGEDGGGEAEGRGVGQRQQRQGLEHAQDRDDAQDAAADMGQGPACLQTRQPARLGQHPGQHHRQAEEGAVEQHLGRHHAVPRRQFQHRRHDRETARRRDAQGDAAGDVLAGGQGWFAPRPFRRGHDRLRPGRFRPAAGRSAAGARYRWRRSRWDPAGTGDRSRRRPWRRR